LRPAEELLVELGITEPRDIDVPAIAFCVGVEVQYRRLIGCEAQIIGFRDGAVVYVDERVRNPRRRFSTGHELGHWYHHRGLSFVCRPDDIGKPTDTLSKNAERLADGYSGDLILPPFMVEPRLDSLGEITLDGVIALSQRLMNRPAPLPSLEYCSAVDAVRIVTPLLTSAVFVCVGCVSAIPL